MTGGWRFHVAGQATRVRWRRELVSELLRPLELEAALPEALADAADEHESRVVADALRTLSDGIARGRAVSEALEEVAPLADDAMRTVVRAGERAGALVPALQALENVLEEQAVSFGRSRDAWIEPAYTLVVALIVTVGLLLGPLLVLVGLSDPGRTGLVARGLAVLSAEPAATAAVVVVLAVLAVVAVRWVVGSERLGHRLPLVGPVRREAERALGARCLALLVAADVPVDEALGVTAELLPRGSRARRSLRETATRAAAGEPFAESGPDAEALGPLLAAVLAGGGREAIAAGLARLADFHEWELERRGQVAARASELVAVCVAGLVAGAVVITTWGTYFGSLGSFTP